jgi:hypothetical protein
MKVKKNGGSKLIIILKKNDAFLNPYPYNFDMRLTKSHSIFLTGILVFTLEIMAQNIPESSPELSPEENLTSDSNMLPDEGKVERLEERPLNPPKSDDRNIIWASSGVGSPGNGLDTPNTHIELGIDYSLNEYFKWGPYYQLITANKKEAFDFPATGYFEKRKYLVSANVLGLQTRIFFFDEWHGRFGLGLSQTKMEIKSIDTNAPIASTSVGYSKSFPLGFSLVGAIQRVWNLDSFIVESELGYNVTAANSNESFTEVYLAAVLRIPIGSVAGPILKQPTPEELNKKTLESKPEPSESTASPDL